MAKNQMTLTLRIQRPSYYEILEVCRRWESMKKELGEDICPADITEELTPLLIRLYEIKVE